MSCLSYPWYNSFKTCHSDGLNSKLGKAGESLLGSWFASTYFQPRKINLHWVKSRRRHGEQSNPPETSLSSSKSKSPPWKNSNPRWYPVAKSISSALGLLFCIKIWGHWDGKMIKQQKASIQTKLKSSLVLNQRGSSASVESLREEAQVSISGS